MCQGPDGFGEKASFLHADRLKRTGEGGEADDCVKKCRGEKKRRDSHLRRV